MATGIVREYIGARYVPKFFENENNTPEWAPNVQYEPLTIVTYNQNSYTSKKPVPASVGNPSDNPTYWASTGNYNAQVEAYRQEVVQFKNDILDQIGTVSPMDYGAVGDGIADDSAAVQAAGADGVVFDPDHVYYIGEIIYLVYGAKDTEFYLEKDAAVVSTSGKAMYTGCKFRKNPAELADGTRGEWSLVVRNQKPINISHNEFYNVVSALYVDKCSGIIEGNYFHDIPQTAAGLGGNGYGIITVACDGLSICGNLFKDVARHEVYLSQDDTPSVRNRNIYIHDNTFNRTSSVQGSTTGFEENISIRPTVNLHIHHNTFINPKKIISDTMQITGDAPYALGSEHVFIDSNIIINQDNPQRPGDGIFTLTGNPTETDGFVMTDIAITNNLIYDTHPTPGGCFIRMQSTSGALIRGNKFYNSNLTYGISIPDARDKTLSKNIEISDNEIKCITFFRVPNGTGYNLGYLRFLRNIIKADYIFEFVEGCSVDEFIMRDNSIEATGSTNATRGITLNKIDMCGNTCNIKIAWSVTAANENYYNYDNLFSPLSSGTYSHMKRGAVLALSDNTIGIVQANGSLKIIS